MQGTNVNGYILKRLLGEGGMAEVWYAENEIGMPAAVKILYDKMTRNEQMLERFHNEAVVMVKLSHPNIRRVFGYGYIDNRHCIVMEYLEGNDLGSLLQSGRHFTDAELRRWWNQTADALNSTHAQGIVHRDIKPSNLFLDKEGNIKLLDFGIAKMQENNSMTRTGSLMGTLMYMSPEQVNDTKHVDYHTDLYSLAVTFVHLLTGKAPYDESSSSYLEIPLSIVTKPLDLSEVPSEWQDFLNPYLAKNPNDRPSSCQLVPVPEAVQTSSDQSMNPEAYRQFLEENQQLLEENRQLKERVHQLEDLLAELKAKYGCDDIDSDIPTTEEVEEQETIDTVEEAIAEVITNVDDLVITVNGLSLVMKRVEGGTFNMGTEEFDFSADSDESPIHEVVLDSFFLGETEVTKAMYDVVIGNGNDNAEKPDNPKSNVSWHDCHEMIQRLNFLTGRNFRLPTEAEWEFAARGGIKGNGYRFAGSDNVDDVAWHEGNSENKSHPVGQKQPNELGLYDMSGNLAEWCEDIYGDYDETSQTNPKGASTGAYRVMRGGSWGFTAQRCRVTKRECANPDARNSCYGLRLALSE